MSGKLRVVGLVFSVWLAGCGGDEEPQDAGRDAAVRDAGTSTRDGGTDGSTATADAAVDGGIVPFDAGGDPVDFVEPEGADTDPFLDGAPAATGAELTPGVILRFAGTIGAGGGNEAWADSDAYAFSVSAEMRVQARVDFGASSRIFSVAIHRADKRLIAWWGMSQTGRALTSPVTLPPGDYFVHVAAAPPTPTSDEAYVVQLAADTLGACESATTTGFAELEALGSSGANDVHTVTLGAFPRLLATSAADAAEMTAVEVAEGASVALEGASDDVANDGDTYLDRDTYRVRTGPDVQELRILLEHVSADVNLDVMVFDAATGALVGLALTVGDSPETAAVAVQSGHDYDVWIAARDERRIGGDTALPLSYRATLCGFGGAR